MSVLLFINLKGGVAKTTNTVAVAECLAASGLRVLVVDADHQCMAGELLLGETRLLQCERKKMTLHDLMAAMLDPEFSEKQLPYYALRNASDIGEGLPKLSVLPCSIRIDDFQTNIAKARKGFQSTEEFQATWSKRRNLFRRWLTQNYDYTPIDCPPSIPQQVRFLLSVADSFVVPSIPDRLSVRGSLWLLDRIRRLGFKLDGLGTLWSLYREQNSLHKRTIEKTAKGVQPYDQLPKPFKTIIPNAAAIAESTEEDRKPKTFSAKYTSQFAKLYKELCSEIIARSEWQAQAAEGVISAKPAETVSV